MTLVCVPGTLISRALLSRSRYEALPVTGSQANETLHDVLPVTRRFNGPVGPAGGFLVEDFAEAGESGAVSDDSSGAVVSPHDTATTRIDPARAHETDCRIADRIRSPLIAEEMTQPDRRSYQMQASGERRRSTTNQR